MGTQSSSLQTLWMYNGIDCMCACQNWYIHSHETWLKVLDTPSFLRHLAHETMHTSMLCWLCHCTHMNALHLYIVHAHLPLIGRKIDGAKVESCQIR